MALNGPNAQAVAALNEDLIRPFWVVWLDIPADPVRVSTAPYAVQFAGTGDEDLDGIVYEPAKAEFMDIGPVHHKEDGSDTVIITLSGQIGPDTGIMNLIGDKSQWLGNVARAWEGVLDQNFNLIDIWPYYTGYMYVPKFQGDSSEQTILLEVESYYSLLTRASGRTYLSQKEFDPGDLSADAMIAIANGTSGLGLTNGGGIAYQGTINVNSNLRLPFR